MLPLLFSSLPPQAEKFWPWTPLTQQPVEIKDIRQQDVTTMEKRTMWKQTKAEALPFHRSWCGRMMESGSKPTWLNRTRWDFSPTVTVKSSWTAATTWKLLCELLVYGLWWFKCTNKWRKKPKAEPEWIRSACWIWKRRLMCERVPAAPGFSSGRQLAEPESPWPLLPPASPSPAAPLPPLLAFVPAPTPAPCGSAPPALRGNASTDMTHESSYINH